MIVRDGDPLPTPAEARAWSDGMLGRVRRAREPWRLDRVTEDEAHWMRPTPGGVRYGPTLNLRPDGSISSVVRPGALSHPERFTGPWCLVAGKWTRPTPHGTRFGPAVAAPVGA